MEYDTREKVIALRVTKAERLIIKAAAQSYGMSTSSFVAACALNQAKKRNQKLLTFEEDMIVNEQENKDIEDIED